jgi:hypothetical protein
MSIRNIMWTALPNGLTPSGDHLKLSVLVSPRLETDGAVDGTLIQFPDFLDWPKTVANLSFTVEFQGGPSSTVKPVTEPGYPGLDSAAWTALFNDKTPVHPFGFDDRSGVPVRSFPTKKVLSFLTEQYTIFAVQTPDQKPSLSQLGFVDGGKSLGRLDEIVIDPAAQKRLDAQLDDLLHGLNYVPANFGRADSDFYQVRVMHKFLSKVEIDPNGPVQARPTYRKLLPKQRPTDLDLHKVVASLSQYAKLMRAMGLAIDLEVPLQGAPPASTMRVVPSLAGPAPMTPWTAYQINLPAKSFLPAPGPDSDVAGGMLLLTDQATQYDVVELDVDGAAEKAMDFASNMSRIAFGPLERSIDTPLNYGLPSLRSAGFSAARADRAKRLVDVFHGARDKNQNITQTPPKQVILQAEDVTRGYRIDVWSSLDGQWQSLCARDGTYTFLTKGLTRSFSDEGFVTVATSQSTDGTTPDLRLPESLFRWAGWSLSAPRVGRTIGSDSTPQDVQNPPVTDFQLQTAFRVTKGTLPRLRFGAQYQFRARAVDLAANSIPHDAILGDIYNLPPQPLPYLRYEPVVAPAIVLRAPLGPDTTPGESAQTIVIRSNFDTHIAAVSERHIASPKTTEIMAETHGMLDTPAGPPDKALYTMLTNKDGDFGVDPAHPDKPVPHPEAQLRLPYLPDPFAPGAAFRTLPGTPSGSVWKTPFTKTWPEVLPFRLVLDEGSGPPTFVENATERVLTVHLPKAEIATVAMSCFLTDDASAHPPSILSTMKIWSWIVGAKPLNLSHLEQLALDGGHWMLTPPKQITFVHAVQQPLIEPQFQHLTAARVLGQTSADLTDEFPISGKSTIKVGLEAHWQEPVDDLTDTTNPQPITRDGSAKPFELALQVGDVVATIDAAHVSNKHEFHDTKHRSVAYTAVAATRFREYFLAAITDNEHNITRKSVPLTISIPSSARPAAAQPLYVIPAFEWETNAEGAWTVSKRSGGGLRVYLQRPWFSSGEGELLGVVMWGYSPPPHSQFLAFETPDYLKGYVTQWGLDPIWTTDAPPSEAVPLPEHFRNAVKIGTDLSLDELSNQPYVPFSVAGHTVAYNLERNLWYCDIVIDPGDSYFPFVRLALARYQPESLPDAHLSRVVLADFVQLMPDRAASITFDPLDPTALQLAVTGLTYRGPGTPSMTATVQMQPAGGGGDLAWVPVSVIVLTAHTFGGPDTLWSGPITLPAARGSRPLRILIEEFESFDTDVFHNQQKRLVYADILNL